MDLWRAPFLENVNLGHLRWVSGTTCSTLEMVIHIKEEHFIPGRLSQQNVTLAHLLPHNVLAGVPGHVAGLCQTSASLGRGHKASAGAPPCVPTAPAAPGDRFYLFISIRNLWQRLGHLGAAKHLIGAVPAARPAAMVGPHPHCQPKAQSAAGNPRLSPRMLCWVVAVFDTFTVF